jgi:hypothetical protein
LVESGTSDDSQSQNEIIEKEGTHGEYTFPEHDDVHVEWLEVSRAVLVLVEATEAHKVIVPEELDLLASFFHLDVFCRQWVDREDLMRDRR